MTLRRRAALRSRLVEAELDALLVTRLVNVRYLTGFTGSNATLLITADGAADLLVTDGRYAAQSAAQVPDVERAINPPEDWLAQQLGTRPRLGLESHDLPWDRALALIAALPGVAVVAAPCHVEELRQRKDAGEIAAIRRACAIADEAFAALLGWLRPGLSELDVSVRLDRSMVDLGAADRSFETIVAAGPNSAIPHHRPTRRVLARGDLVNFDFGALVDGYHSDMTRMVALGEPSARLREVFSVVHAAQAAGLERVCDHVAASSVDEACRCLIEEAGYGERFVHGTGHGLGLEIHEGPRLGAESPVTLCERMVVTVEPGVYLPDLGGVRIEDTVVVRTQSPPQGAEVLTSTPKDLVIL